MTTLKNNTPSLFNLKGIILVCAFSALFIQGCGDSKKADAQSKAGQKFYQHDDAKTDPYLPKKDD
jgi:hypothetical protein